MMIYIQMLNGAPETDVFDTNETNVFNTKDRA